MLQTNQTTKGFGVVSVLLGLAIIVLIVGTAFYMSDLTKQQPTLDSGLTAIDRIMETEQSDDAPADTSDDSVTYGSRLNLSNQGLTKLPAYVLSRTDLEELDLSGNKLTGALPGEIRFLKNLKKLDVSNNPMTGIPAEIGQLSRLEILDYSNNQITGLPNELGNLTNLKTFILTGNNFSQADLAGITQKLPNLEVIY